MNFVGFESLGNSAPPLIVEVDGGNDNGMYKSFAFPDVIIALLILRFEFFGFKNPLGSGFSGLLGIGIGNL